MWGAEGPSRDSRKGMGRKDGSFSRGHLEGLPSPTPGGHGPRILGAGSSASLIPVLGPQST